MRTQDWLTTRRTSSLRAIFISPHLDDVAFSCGGTVARYADAGDETAILTLCSDGPHDSGFVSEFCSLLHGLWSHIGVDDPPQLWQRRRGEDRAAADVLGTTAVWLGELDALYRGYTSSAELRGPHRPGDAEVRERTSRQLRALLADAGHATYFFPLAIGHNVDHRHCFDLGVELHHAGARVVFYEDFPYVLETEDAAAIRAAAIGLSLVPEVVDVTEQLPRRITASACYCSQVPMVFRHYPDGLEQSLRNYASSIAGEPGRFAERWWSPASTPTATTA